MLFSLTGFSNLSLEDSVTGFFIGGSIVLTVVLLVTPEVGIAVVVKIGWDGVESEACAVVVTAVVVIEVVAVVGVVDCSDEEDVGVTGDPGGVSCCTWATLNNTCDNWDAT